MFVNTGFNWTVVIGIIILLVFLDKFITFVNIKAIEKNFPKIKDPFSAEKNPLARWFFVKFGLVWGSILYGIVSLISFFLALLMLGFAFRLFWPATAWSIALYVLIIWYCLVIGNNVFFLLKFTGKVP